ncbi:MAG: phosphate/phosphite/phosphonate ABC transporter substrate-binding protein [Gammaproteobacteria bacterium]|nr:phosphate/phosphite/phosphonate ABC transporter substrate-binding protein [Gammaproteobacteria bacterium]MBU2478291.1 phosphate/phosphite/phosphonate ABC transporter substrate-binding protein [Gammaproteobacteria bacterium]
MTLVVGLCRLLYPLLLLWAVGAVSASPASVDETAELETITVGIVPQQTASQLARIWTPILQYLGSQSGYNLRFKTAKDIPTFEQRLAAGEYDLAYMNPYHYTVFHAVVGYRALVVEKDRWLRGVVVVRKDSHYKTITELRGARIAFPAPAAFAASVLTSRFLEQNGVQHVPIYVDSHDSVYLSVAKGLYPAGGGIIRTFDNIDAGVRARLRVLWETPGVMSHPIAVHPRMSSDISARLKRAFLSMAETEKGKALLAAAGFEGFSAVDDADYDQVRRLDIHLLDHFLEK